MVQSVTAQTDDSWHLILIDDGSILAEADEAFALIGRELGDKATVIRRTRNSGQGLCRNLGARWAWRAGMRFCIYLDSDDRADVMRIETVRRIFDQHRGADFLYSSFKLIDEAGRSVPNELITPSIKEILDSHEHSPPVGKDAWKEIAVTRGYTTLTSAVSVRTWLAVAHPFPDVYVSEDQHTWLRMMAATDGVVFDNSTMSFYRVTTDGSGSSVRKRVGPGYYEQKAWVDTAGFIAAMRIALRLGKLDLPQVPELLSAFYARSARTLEGEERLQAAAEYHRLGERVISEKPELSLACLPTRPRLFIPGRTERVG
jgi:glycosyl transferase family 2